MTDNFEPTNDYLEYLAGRRKSPPKLSADDRDILQAARLLHYVHPAQADQKFLDALRKKVMTTSPAPKKSPAPKSAKSSMTWVWALRLTLPALAMATIVLALWQLPAGIQGPNQALLHQHVVQEAEAATINLQANNSDSSGVQPNTTFTLTAKDGTLTTAMVEKKLTFQPAVDTAITQKNSTTFVIAPKKPLDKNTVYVASYDGLAKTLNNQTEPRLYSWAFQVRNDFVVLGTYPRNQVTGISTTTGIEVTFAQSGVTATDFQKHFAISPATNGRIEVHQRTLVFVPSAKLTPQTVYTVTIAHGLQPTGSQNSLATDYTFQFETSPDKQTPPTSPIQPQNFFESVQPNQPIVFGQGLGTVYDSKTGTSKPATYDFTIYKYQNINDFKSAINNRIKAYLPWAYDVNTNYTYSFNGLTKVATVKTQSKDGVLTLPKGFAEGQYLADSTSNGAHSQIPFVVSNLSGYAMATKTDSLVWVNDLSTGKAVVGAKISGIDQTNATTDDQGLARFTTPSSIVSGDVNDSLLDVTAGKNSTVFLLNANSNGFYNRFRIGSCCASDDYWSYVTTDRIMYQPNDTLHFWGLVRPRNGQASNIPTTVELVSQNYDSRYTETIVASTNVTLTSDGTFIGQLKLNDLPLDGSSKLLRVRQGDTIITSRYLDVEAYRKPAYQLTVTPNKYALFDGQKVTYTVTASFFDGTPVPDAKIKLTAGNEYTLTTGSDGTVKQTVQVGLGQGQSVFAVPADDSTTNIEGDASVQVYPAAVQITAQGTTQNNTATVSGIVRNIYPDRAVPTAEDPLAKVVGDPRPGQTVTGTLIAVVYDKTPAGTSYDFLSKQVVTNYTYTSHDETRKTFSLVTDAQGKFSIDLPVDTGTFYRVELQAVDTQNRIEKETVYLDNFGAFNGYANPSLSALDPLSNQNNNYSPKYAVGQQASLEIVDGSNQPVDVPGQSYLYITASRGLGQVTLSTSSTYTFPFATDYVPDVGTRVVVFNGHGYQEIYGPIYTFDSASKKLNIDITTDKTTYGIRQPVNITIKVTDQQGNGVHARVNVKAIDEAVSVLQPDWLNTNPLSDLYKYVSDGVLGTYVSHQAFGAFNGAEGGGGGGGRQDFRDNALYTEVETNGQGVATTSFTTPDNLTSWRIGADAISPDLQAGQATKLVPVQQGLFIVPTMESTMLSVDQQHARAVAFGTGLKKGEAVNFVFSIDGQPQADATVAGKAFEPVTYNMPALPPGKYSVSFSASAQGQSDEVTLPLVVVASNLKQQTVNFANLEQGQQPKLGANGRTVLSIGDADRSLAYQTLWQLLGNPYARLDDAAAADMASTMLNQTFQQPVAIETIDPYQYQTGKGIALYPQGSDNIEYGALAAGDPNLAAIQGQLVPWFQSVVDDPKTNTEQVAQALYGLAQLHQPVLPQIEQLLSVSGLADSDKLTLALALETIGAKEEARPIAAYLFDQYGQTKDQYTYLTLGSSSDDKIVSTARYGILAAGLRLPTEYGLLRYSSSHPPKDTTTHLEQMLAVNRLMNQANTGKVSVTYTLDGGSTTKEISSTDLLSLSLDQDQAKTFAITGHTGNVAVVATYSAPFAPSDITVDPHLSLTRTYTVNGKTTTSFKRGDIIKVQFSWAKKTGAIGNVYGLVDYLPTGLRPLSNPVAYSGYNPNQAYPYAIEGSRVKMYLYTGQPSFYYLAQAVIGGTAVAEPPVLQSFDAPSSIQIGPASQGVTIKD